jgi:hypothetical protein
MEKNKHSLKGLWDAIKYISVWGQRRTGKNMGQKNVLKNNSQPGVCGLHL